MSFVSQAEFCFSSNKQFIPLIFHILPEFFYFTAVSFWILFPNSLFVQYFPLHILFSQV